MMREEGRQKCGERRWFVLLSDGAGIYTVMVAYQGPSGQLLPSKYKFTKSIDVLFSLLPILV
jgi:hypothetical protein